MPRTGLAQAQNAASYPDRPIRLVVAFPPGGATDTLARQVTQELGEALGQSVVIENKPGAGGYIAWNYVASSDPDGYTLLMAENALGISQALYKKTQSFDPLKQYDAIASVASSPLVLAVANNVKANSVAELIAYSRTVPQKMNYASAGIGSVSHLTFEVLKIGDRDGGGSRSLQGRRAGHERCDRRACRAQHGVHPGREGPDRRRQDQGRLRSPARSARRCCRTCRRWQQAGVKTADVDLRFWFGIFGPKGMPDAVRAKLEKAVFTDAVEPAGARTPGQARHHAGFRSGRRDARQARERDHQLDQVHRRARHQAAMNRDKKQAEAGVSAGYDFIVNGKPVHVDTDGTKPLLSVLRDELALRGSRFGCGTEQCGACMVLIDGKPEFSCAREIATVAGRSITTIEGLAQDGALHPLQQAFLDEQAGQCGYCLVGHPDLGGGACWRAIRSRPAPTSSRRSTRISAAAACTTASSAPSQRAAAAAGAAA